MSHSMSFNDKTYDTQVSNPEPEPEFIGKEGKPNFTKALIWISIDVVLTGFLIFVQYGLFGIFEDELKKMDLIIVGSIAFLFFAFIITFVVSRVTTLVIIAKFCYIIGGSIYYAYKLVIMIIYLIQKEGGISDEALIFFIVILATIIPRVFGFYNIVSLEKVCKKVDDSKRILEHEKFVEKIGNKIDVGYSRWSNTLTVERASSANNFDNKEE